MLNLPTNDRLTIRQLMTLGGIVFAFAAWVRLPYCTESFWIDELHSAWTVWGSLGEVANRASLGNQTPVYFWGLWFWRWAVGDGEMSLRLSSVLLSSLACSLVATGVAHQTRNLVGGIVAGILMSVDPHAVFFGTELRVFPATLVMSAAALWAWCEHRRTTSTPSAVGLFVAVTLAALIQPTSLGILGWLLVSRFHSIFSFAPGEASRSSHKRPLLAIAVVLMATAFTFWMLAGTVLLAAWQHRHQWASFGSAQSIHDIGKLWRWSSLVLIPGGLALVAITLDHCGLRPRGVKLDDHRPSPAPPHPSEWIAPALLVLIGTLVFWGVAATGIAAIFHRRYMIAALPILAWSGGVAAAQVAWSGQTLIDRCITWWKHHRHTVTSSTAQARPNTQLWMATLAMIAAILWHYVHVAKSPRSKILRGEGWREAAAFVAASDHLSTDPTLLTNDRPILLSPGLIETDRFLASGDPEKIRYLAFPLCGPYHLPEIQIIQLGTEVAGNAQQTPVQLILQQHADTAILRSSHRTAQQWAQRVVAASGQPVRLSFETHRFGTIQVVRFKHI